MSDFTRILEILSATPAGILFMIFLLILVVGLFIWIPTAIFKIYKANIEAQKQSATEDANTIGALTTVLRSVMTDISENTRRSSQAAERMVLTSDALIAAMSDGFKNRDEKAALQQRELMDAIGRHNLTAAERNQGLLEAIHKNGQAVNQNQAVMLERIDRLGLDLTILVQEAMTAASKSDKAQDDSIKSLGLKIDHNLGELLAGVTDLQTRLQDCPQT